MFGTVLGLLCWLPYIPSCWLGGAKDALEGPGPRVTKFFLTPAFDPLRTSAP